jgi:hypothetical protein
MNVAYQIIFIICCLIVSTRCDAQKEMSDKETQYLLSLMKETKEYKELRHKADSMNNVAGYVLYEVRIWAANNEKNIYSDTTYGHFGFSKFGMQSFYEEYGVTYDRKKKQILYMRHNESMFRP